MFGLKVTTPALELFRKFCQFGNVIRTLDPYNFVYNFGENLGGISFPSFQGVEHLSLFSNILHLGTRVGLDIITCGQVFGASISSSEFSLSLKLLDSALEFNGDDVE